MTTEDLQWRFRSFLEEHKKILFKICNAYCKNRDDREDLAQEIACQLWRAFAAYDESIRFSTWMYRIALNVAISFYRHESTIAKRVVSGDERLLNMVEDPKRDTDEIVVLHQFIEGLDPLNRALVLLYLDGNSYREIAEVLGISETNVATKLNRLKQAARAEINSPGG